MSGLGASIRTAGSIGAAAGAVVGVFAAAAAADGSGLTGFGVWAAWFGTVGVFAVIGWLALGLVGVLGGLAGMIPRARIGAPGYAAIGTAFAVAALMFGKADLAVPAESLLFRLLPGVGISLAAAILVGVTAWWLVGSGRWGALGGAWERLPMRERRFLRRCGALVAVLAVAGATVYAVRVAYPAGPRDAPNVLLVTVDALRTDRIGAYGSERGLTPHLDRLARDAVVFENAFAPAPWTAASVGAMLVSLYPSETGLVARDRSHYAARFQGGVFAAQPTLAEMLREAGYDTAADVPNPQIRRDRGMARGFLRFRNPYDFAGERAPVLPRWGKYETWALKTSLGMRLAAAFHRESRYYRGSGVEGDDAERLVRDSVAWLRGDRRRPFFLWLHPMDPHVPYNPHQKSAATMAAFPKPPLRPTTQFFKDLVWREITIGDTAKRYLEALYDDEVRVVDTWLGRLFDDLRARGVYDRTLIIITADHGEEFWEHGGCDHGRTLYDEVMRVPLLVKFPANHHAGRRVRDLASLLDLLPTVAEVAGLPAPSGIRGRSLLEALRSGDGKRELYFESTLYGEELKGLRTSHYKVIFRSRTRALEVYDLRSDPAETHNLAEDPSIAADLRERVIRFARDSQQRNAWWARHGGPTPALDERSAERLRSLGYVAD